MRGCDYVIRSWFGCCHCSTSYLQASSMTFVRDRVHIDNAIRKCFVNFVAVVINDSWVVCWHSVILPHNDLLFIKPDVGESDYFQVTILKRWGSSFSRLALTFASSSTLEAIRSMARKSLSLTFLLLLPWKMTI